MQDKVFGSLNYYDGCWEREYDFKFLGMEQTVKLMVYVDEAEPIEQIQYDSFEKFQSSLEYISQLIEKDLFDYYCNERRELGYEAVPSRQYPEISDFSELLQMIKLIGIVVPCSQVCEALEGRVIGLLFDCSWDKEFGLGIQLVNEKIEEIGYQDAAL